MWRGSVSRVVVRGMGVIVCMVATTLATSPAAWAGYAAGAYKTLGPYGGIKYENNADIVTYVGSTPPSAGAYSGTVGGAGNVPAGWIGVNAKSYSTAGGGLCVQTYMTYSSITSSGFYVSTPFTNCGRGNYQGKGQSASWTGTGYAVNDTYASPYQTW